MSDDELSVPTVCFPGSQCAYFSTHLEVTFGGDYVTPATAQFSADASMTVISKNETRVGIVTLSTFDAFHKFRLLFEYNPNGLNGGKGFDDTTTPGDNVFFTFSRVFEPRLELLPEHTDAFAIFGSSRKVKDMAFAYDVRNDDWPDMFAGPSDDDFPRGPPAPAGRRPSRRDEEPVRSLGVRAARAVEPGPQALPDPDDRALPRDDDRAHYPVHMKTDDDLDGTIALGDRTSNANVFMKIPIPSAYNVPGPQPRQLQLSPPVHVEKIRIRVLDHDLTPYPMHGREMTISLVFDGGKIVVGATRNSADDYFVGPLLKKDQEQRPWQQHSATPQYGHTQGRLQKRCTREGRLQKRCPRARPSPKEMPPKAGPSATFPTEGSWT